MASSLSSWMLKIVIANPTQFAIVSAGPTRCLGALWALRVENCGESPTTTIPQNTRKARNTGTGAKKMSGNIAHYTLRGENRSEVAKDAKAKVPRMRPGCTGEVIAPNASGGSCYSRCRSPRTGFGANHNEAPANCDRMSSGKIRKEVRSIRATDGSCSLSATGLTSSGSCGRASAFTRSPSNPGLQPRGLRILQAAGQWKPLLGCSVTQLWEAV